MTGSRREHFVAHFDAVVARAPLSTAIERVLSSGEVRRISYGALRAASERLGEQLRALGIGAGAVVGLWLPKGAGWVAALLGCWRAGVAVLPLSPEAPEERARWALLDAGAVAWVEAEGGAEGRLRCVWVDAARAPSARSLGFEFEADLSARSDLSPRADLPLDALAYVIYTSGSGGRPKGVRVRHRGLPLVITQQIDAFGYSPAARSLWLLSPVFDASLSDVGVSLLSGGTLIIAEGLEAGSSAGLMRRVGELGVTHIDLPPALLSLYDPSEAPACLEHLTVGGEAAPVEVMRRWASRVRLVNVYGPTEATICTSLVRCDPLRWRDADIGAPLAGVEYALWCEDALTLTPLSPQEVEPQEGEPQEVEPREVEPREGELWISGETLAEGYTDPELTRARFVWRGGRRWYRTGDLVRHSSGRSVFMGRLDRQLKVAGALVAPEEVEATLRAHPSVAEAAVFGVGGGHSAQATALCAAVVLRAPIEDQEERVTGEITGEITGWLTARLPRWLIPSRWVSLPALPRLPSHKVDYSALRGRFEQAVAQGGARGWGGPELTQTLTALWGRALGRADLHAGSDFFEEGGDSLALIDLVTSAQAMGLHMTLSLLTSAPTPHLAAAALLMGRDGGEARAVEELTPLAALPPWLSISEQAAGERPHQGPPPTPCYLITGASGFLGAHLTRDLLRAHPSARVIALARAPVCLEGAAQTERDRERARDAAALRRVRDALTAHALHLSPDEGARLKAVAGDIGARHLALSPKRWRDLSERVTHVVHCAAEVHMTRTYESLAPINVGGLLHALELTRAGRRKALIYCSTLSVFVSTDQNTGDHLEADDLLGVGRVYGGYAQSKWVAERALCAPQLSDLPITILRLGLLTASGAGVSASRDFLGQLIGGLLDLGGAPEGAHSSISFDMTPVDYASEVIAALCVSPEVARSGRRVLHVANSPGVTFEALLRHLRARGLPLRPLSTAEWEALHLRAHALSPRARLALMGLCRLSGGARFEAYRSVDLFQATGSRFCDDALQEALRSSGRPELRPPLPAQALAQLTLEGLGVHEPVISCFEQILERHTQEPPQEPPPERPPLAPTRAPLEVCVLGPESAGKTTLCEALRVALGAREGAREGVAVIPEAARPYLEALAAREGEVGGGAPTLRAAHFERIAAAQALLRDLVCVEARARGDRWVISDTCALLTGVWAESLCEGPPPHLTPWVEAERFDLYLLLRPDLPWVGDPARYQPDLEGRARFFERCEALLRERDLRFVIIEGAGDVRLERALEALKDLGSI